MTASPKTPEKAAEKAVDEVQAKADVETEQGYRGIVPDAEPNSAYSLKSGPDAPPVHEPKTKES